MTIRARSGLVTGSRFSDSVSASVSASASASASDSDSVSVSVSDLPWKKWTGYLRGLRVVQEIPLFELVGAKVAERRVKAARVVPALDVAGDGVLGGTSGRPALSV